MIHNFSLCVYYEDTDLAGIVYYANYLKFIERGRSTLVRKVGIDQLFLKKQGYLFAVKSITANYHASAQMDDELTVKTVLISVSGAKIIFDQRVFNSDKLLFSSIVTIAYVTIGGRPTRLPSQIIEKLQQFAA
tara:strand:+ start:1882 stop:2280 length:399 start_codon:yes stop_codon:yes gene_type:complete